MHPLYAHKFQIKSDVWVFVPSPDAVDIGEEIKDEIESKWVVPDYYYHHKSGGHVAALKAHIHNSYFLALDIKDFFGSINKTKVTRSLKNILPYKNAREVANKTVLKHPEKGNFILPYGFVQSPLVASICLFYSGLGQWLDKQQRREEITLSIYVDDILVSANDETLLSVFLKEAAAIGAKTGFQLNMLKIQGPSPKVIIFNVEVGQYFLNITDLRLAEFSDVFRESGSKLQQRGILEYIKSINRLQHDDFVIDHQNYIIGN